MLRRTFAALLLACAACRPDASAAPGPNRRASTAPVNATAPANSAAVPTASADSAAEEADARRPFAEYAEDREGPRPPAHPAGYLVWSAEVDRPAATVWLDAAGRTVAARPGVYIAHDARLWRWMDRRWRVTGVDCACRNYTPNEDCTRTRELRGAYLLDLATGARVWTLPVADSLGASGEEAPVQRAEPVTGAGPYLQIRVVAVYQSCGPHDSPYEDVQMIDVAADREVHAGSRERVTRRDGVAAAAAFEATRVDWGADSEREPEGPGTLWAFEAQWLPAGRLQGGYRFYKSSCFICGDRGESYMRTLLIADSVLPRWMAPWSAAPEPVRRHWREPRLRRAWRPVTRWDADTSVTEHQYWYADSTALRTGWSAVDSANAPRLLELFKRR